MATRKPHRTPPSRTKEERRKMPKRAFRDIMSQRSGGSFREIVETAHPRALFSLGITARQLHARGIPVKLLKRNPEYLRYYKAMGLSAKELFEIGFEWPEVKELYTVKELKDAGVTAGQLFLNIPMREWVRNFTLKELQADEAHLKERGFSLDHAYDFIYGSKRPGPALKRAGFTPREFLKGGASQRRVAERFGKPSPEGKRKKRRREDSGPILFRRSEGKP